MPSTIISAKDDNTNNFQIQVDRFPDFCHRCHKHMEPRVIGCNHVGVWTEVTHLELALRCTNSECGKLSVAEYRKEKHTLSPARLHVKFVKMLPKFYQEHSFPEEIKEVSPNFVNIYNQALEAEATGLDQITGVGLRKALEFLLKDFCISSDPDNPEHVTKIKKLFLGKVIKDEIGSGNLQKIAERAVWLGNDETHYSRVWEDKDIDDLKTLIKIGVNHIENEIKTQRYIDEMSDSGPAAVLQSDAE